MEIQLTRDQVQFLCDRLGELEDDMATDIQQVAIDTLYSASKGRGKNEVWLVLIGDPLEDPAVQATVVRSRDDAIAMLAMEYGANYRDGSGMKGLAMSEMVHESLCGDLWPSERWCMSAPDSIPGFYVKRLPDLRWKDTSNEGGDDE